MKGLARVLVELGLLVLVGKDQHGFILSYRVMPGRPNPLEVNPCGTLPPAGWGGFGECNGFSFHHKL